MTSRSTIAVLTALTAMLPLGAFAQLSLLSGGGLTITASPAYPAPHETVVLTAESALADLSRASIVWYEDGTRAGEGLSIEVTAGALGSVTSYIAEASDRDGLVAAGSITIRPTSAEIAWESDALTPPFYRGRALAGAATRIHAEANVRFVRPDGSYVAPQDIYYSWRRNDRALPSLSGRGKSQVLLPAPLLFGSDRITVSAESVDGLFAAEAATVVPSTDTVLLLYPDHPLFGIRYNQAVSGTAQIPEAEMTFAAVPYFTQARTSADSNLVYRWSVNGREVESDPQEPDRITLSSEGDTGLAFIELALESASNWFEAARSSWQVTLSGNLDSILNDPFRKTQE